MQRSPGTVGKWYAPFHQQSLRIASLRLSSTHSAAPLVTKPQHLNPTVARLLERTLTLQIRAALSILIPVRIAPSFSRSGEPLRLPTLRASQAFPRAKGLRRQDCRLREEETRDPVSTAVIQIGRKRGESVQVVGSHAAFQPEIFLTCAANTLNARATSGAEGD